MTIAFAVACVLLNLVPGPGMMFIVAHGLAGGRRAGIAAALGMASGVVVHTAAAALGLSALLRAAPYALDAVRLGGAVFLLYLAFTTLRSESLLATDQPKTSLRRTYLSAVLTNLANPKVVLFYIAFVPQFITAGGWPTASQILTLGAILIVIGLVMDCLLGTAAGVFAAMLRQRPSFQRWLRRLSAAIFGGLALRLLGSSDL